ncbi:hypothetical protein [Porphyromonas macacae]|uniref:hypothetical protein n=1 Tax=Porphyromonas macacae TaxID=28115 RepID=UPI0035A195FD
MKPLTMSQMENLQGGYNRGWSGFTCAMGIADMVANLGAGSSGFAIDWLGGGTRTAVACSEAIAGQSAF